MSTVAVVDFGMGNLRSVCKAIEHVASQATVILTSDAAAVRQADRVVFPGQGAIRSCVVEIDARGLRDAVLEAMRSKPFLGICLGLQALYESSEEDGGTRCFGVLPGKVKHFPRERMIDASTGLAMKVPHMGWNEVEQTTVHPLWKGIPSGTRFYFVHSYYADSADAADIAGTTEYAIRFTSAAARDNIFAVQFHPEKSQKAGLRLLQNFVAWDGQH